MFNTRTKNTCERIISLLDQCGEIHGTQHLVVITCTDRRYVTRVLRKLEADGIITTLRTFGGRGRKSVYKFNRNQPGLPRKVTR
jgi:hypothetical protein